LTNLVLSESYRGYFRDWKKREGLTTRPARTPTIPGGSGGERVPAWIGLLSLQTLDFRKELTQEQQLIPVLWTIRMLLGLNDRFEVENTHAELRDLKLSGSLHQIPEGIRKGASGLDTTVPPERVPAAWTAWTSSEQAEASGRAGGRRVLPPCGETRYWDPLRTATKGAGS
jgi:hypothetical protein